MNCGLDVYNHILVSYLTFPTAGQDEMENTTNEGTWLSTLAILLAVVCVVLIFTTALLALR